MKPLPKRRRMSDPTSPVDVVNEVSMPDSLPPDSTDATAQSFEDLPSYYKSLLSGVKDILKQGVEGRPQVMQQLKGAVSGGRSGRGFDDDGGDGDYMEHLQQPGNTKKRNVPANLAAAGHGPDAGTGQDDGEDEQADRAIPTGRPEEYDSGATPGQVGLGGRKRRGRLTKFMLAGIQHKEMLKNRKRQLAAVLGALTHGDTLALDQALSANYPFMTGMSGDQEPPRVRPSHRLAAVMARNFKTFQSMYPPEEQTVPFPTTEFTFIFASASKCLIVKYGMSLCSSASKLPKG